MKTVLVTPELAGASVPGDVGTFAGQWSRLLRQAGEDVHIILTRPPLRPSGEWRAAYDALGVTLDVLEEPGRFIALPYGYRWHRRIAEIVYERLPPDAAIVYYVERDANGMHHLRQRRYSGARVPVVATVLHGGTMWRLEAARRWPTGMDDLEYDFYERYVAAHSDWVIAPNQALLRWADRAAWCLPPSERVRMMGYPFLPEDETLTAAAPEPPHPHSNARLRRLVCYSVPAALEDIALFAQALNKLRDTPCLDVVEDMLLLGCPGAEPVDAGDLLRMMQGALPGRTITARLDAAPDGARALLAQAAPDSLVVVPRRAAGMDYPVVAASLVPGLELLCADVGGVAEMLGPTAADRLFEPFPTALARALERHLLGGAPEGPGAAEAASVYGWRAANDRWLALHNEIAARARTPSREGGTTVSAAPGAKRDERRDADSTPTSTPTSAVSANDNAHPAGSVDVCIPYYNLGVYLPLVLEALDKQTSQDFNVFVVNDGSPDAAAVAVFETMTRAYAYKPNWRFLTTSNQGVCAARNLVASLGTAKYLCFVDADNIPMPTMIERLLASIRESGDDCLTCYLYVFQHEGAYRPVPGITAPAVHFLPVGNCQTLGLFTNPFGDINCIMRRSAFEAIGGFTNDTAREINHEDRELFTRLSFAGFRIDVVPEFLCFYRERAGGRLHSTDEYLNDARVLRVYTERLAQSGLAGLAPLALGIVRERDATAEVPGQPISLHYLVNQVSARLYLKALPHKLRRLAVSRLGRLHQPK